MLGGLYFDAVYRKAGVPLPQSPQVTLFRVNQDGRLEPKPTVVANLSKDLMLTPASANETFATRFYLERFPSIATGPVPGSQKPRVYVVWHDQSLKRIRVLLSSSDDSGLTWTAPRVVDDSPAVALSLRDNAASHPSIAVNRSGVVGLQWAEFHGNCWRFAISLDGGATFVPSVPINDCTPSDSAPVGDLSRYIHPHPPYPFEPCNSVCIEVGNDWSDATRIHFTRGTTLTASAEGAFHSAWISREGELFTSRIDVDGGRSSLLERRAQVLSGRLASVPGGGRVSVPTIWFDYTHVNYNESTGELDIGVVMVKLHNRKLNWPLVYRVRSVESPLGKLTVENADNGLHQQGAAWVFEARSSSVTSISTADVDATLNARLPPARRYDFSEPRVLRFKFDSHSAGPRPDPDHLKFLSRLDGDIEELTRGP
jgi:hypothetical protein